LFFLLLRHYYLRVQALTTVEKKTMVAKNVKKKMAIWGGSRGVCLVKSEQKKNPKEIKIQ